MTEEQTLTRAQEATFDAFVERIPAASAETFLTSDARIGAALARKGLVEAQSRRIDYVSGGAFGRNPISRSAIQTSYFLTEAGQALVAQLRGEG